MKNILQSILLAGVSCLSVTQVAKAAALYEQDVLCGSEICGTMEISNYKALIGSVDGTQVGGAVIEGVFKPQKNVGFHYIQAIVVDDTPLPFKDGTPLPTNAQGRALPYIDTPPGGYQGQPFDLFPYYDQANLNAFPKYFDEPTNPLAEALDPNLTGADGAINVKFETWLVCVINEALETNNFSKAQDVTYTIAPLLGWSWGYSSKQADSNLVVRLVG